MNPPTTPLTTFNANPFIQRGGSPSISVMIVDDDPAVLTVGKAILSSLPYHIYEARSGESALSMLASLAAENQLPHLIVLDLTMPGGISGFDTLQGIQALYPTVGVLACSGFLESSAHDLCCALGFLDCIEKPYTTEMLTTTVRRCVMKVQDQLSNAPEEQASSEMFVTNQY
jgi:CheY-like chemotaxis protein